MTLLEEIPCESFREASILVLEARGAHSASLSHDGCRGLHFGANKTAGDAVFLITLQDRSVIGACSIVCDDDTPELGYWVGAPYWGKGYATEALHAAVDYAFTDLGHEALQAGARVTNPASRRVLEKCGFQWTGVGLYRIRAINSSAPIDRFRLERRIWSALKGWGRVKKVM